jgi:polo-like kinase 1
MPQPSTSTGIQTLNELLKRRKRLSDIEAKYYIRQVADAIRYIHGQQIIHRDLKLGNLFLSEKLEIKIGDFGLATKLASRGERRRTKCGTPNYIAPEILDETQTHSFEVDIWSMGVIAYALLVGKPPFETSDVRDTYSRIKACHYTFPDSANVPDVAKSFISKMLQLDPSKRATIDEVLADPFLAEETIPALLPISSLACPPSFDFLRKYRENKGLAKPLSHATEATEKTDVVSVEKKNINNYMSQ